jgi:hypothetical protein
MVLAEFYHEVSKIRETVVGRVRNGTLSLVCESSLPNTEPLHSIVSAPMKHLEAKPFDKNGKLGKRI